LGGLVTDQPDSGGPYGEPLPRPDPPDLRPGRGFVEIIPNRPSIDNGIDSGVDDQPPAGTVKTNYGFVFPAIARVNFLYQLPKWLRDRSG